MVDRYEWANKEKTEVTFIGDKVEFQNGFGAYTPMTYFCTFSLATKQITSLDMGEGRIPQS